MNRLALLPFLCLFLYLPCRSQQRNSDSQHSRFAFYLLRDSTVGISRILGVALDSLALSSTPLFRDTDIKTYSWSTHSFTLKPKADSIFTPFLVLGRKLRSIPFVIMVGNERIYLGEFWSPYSSLSPQCAYVFISSKSPYRISYSKPASQPDRRSDKRIHEALQVAGVLVE